MLFCPFCATKLLLKCHGTMGFHCMNCPYKFLVDHVDKHQKKLHFTGMSQHHPTQDDDPLAKDSPDEQVSSIEFCPNRKCDSKKASFSQMQIRSGDEPMTTIYKCIKCGETWRLD
ncbi:hypothetical protein XU18_0013 [Perkinsela sp. CCAP 1560/4]|nr:hypothetical protein XU18_0013 [Perkinsela sp. CCAP 1560/4]|eukprot:KNH09328.1 hypothetical protein XU18_0013 [Perkinsela sp. CCAP 1560/4]